MARLRRARMLRRVAIAGLFAFLALGLMGTFGPRRASVTATNGGYRLTVDYAAVSRPGLTAPWSAEITRDGGFDGPITIAMSKDFFERIDENAIQPAPATTTSVGDFVLWEFDPPPAETLTIGFDGRWEPTWHRPVEVTTAILEGGVAVVDVSYEMRAMP